MSELFQSQNEHDTPAEKPLDKGAILDRLFALADEFGISVEDTDVEYLLGQDDNDFLGNLLSLALESGVDGDELFERLGIELEQPM